MKCFRNKTWRIAAVSILVTILNFAAFCRAFTAQTYHVSPTGDDLFPGTETMPLRQIRKALTLVSAGDTVLVADGNYLGFDVDSLNGSPTAPVTIRARGTNALILSTADRSDNRDTIYVLDSTYLSFFSSSRVALENPTGRTRAPIFPIGLSSLPLSAAIGQSVCSSPTQAPVSFIEGVIARNENRVRITFLGS